MDKKLFLSTLFLYILFSISTGFSQTLETEKVHTLSKEAKKGYLGAFNYDKANKIYTMVFVREKNKKTIYETYRFDYDFNQIDVQTEELSLLQASKKYDWVEYDEGSSWSDPTVVRVDANAWSGGTIVLRKGTISRKWTTDYYETKSVNYTTHNWVGYWKYNFNELEKVKPVIEIPIEFPAGTPKMVKKMAENAAKKIYLVAYQTDEPGVEITTGARSFHPKYTKTIWEQTRDYSAASGDIMVFGYQSWYIQKDFFKRYVALQYSASDLSLKNKTIIEFDYMYKVVKHKFLPDQSLVVILAPEGFYKNPGPNPNPREYYYLRISKDAGLMQKIAFESPSSKWEVNDIVLLPDGDIYVYGEASKEKNDQYYDKLGNISKFDNFQLMKVPDAKIEFITSTAVEEFESKFRIPANIKSIAPYDGKKFDIGPITITSSGDIFISGQENNNGKFGNINLFHFGADGKLKAQYGYKLEETGKEATSQGTLHAEFENPDNNTLTWIVYEMKGIEGTRLLMYPRMATIDLKAAKISDISTYGLSKEGEYYVDNSHPVILIEDDKKAVFFGTDKKDNSLWFSRIKLCE